MRVDWTTLKNFADDRKLSIQYVDINGRYFLRAIDGPFQLSHTIKKESPASSDQSDFETNYQSGGNGIVDIPKTMGLELKRQNINRFNSINKFGSSTAVTATRHPVWNNGGAYTYLSSADTLEVYSSSANDTSAGTGARTVEIQGLDANYNVQTETITLNGTTAVTTTNSFLRVYRAKVITAGSGEENAGDITIETTTGSTVQAEIIATNNQTLMAIYTVPAGKTAYILNYYVSVPKDREVEAVIRIRKPSEVFQIKHQIYLVSDKFTHEFGLPLVATEKSDIQLAAKNLDGITCNMSGGFDIVLVDD